MSFEPDKTPDPGAGKQRSTSEVWGTWGAGGDEEDTQPRPAVSGAPAARGSDEPALPVDSQFTLREHVTGALPVHPADAPRFYPAYNPYQQQAAGYPPSYAGSDRPQTIQPPPGYGYPPYNGYYEQGRGYPYQYPYPPYGWQPPRPKRDGYQLAAAIVTTFGGGLAILAGLGSALLLIILLVLPSTGVSESSYFSSLLTFISFIIAGVIGGSIVVYHGIRAWINKPSANLRLPRFWIPLILYLVVIAAGYILQANGLAVRYQALTIVLIVLAAIFPALAVAALGARRLRLPTTWRHFIVALVSGATLGIGLALILELGLTILVVGSGGLNTLQCLSDPSLPGCDQTLLLKFAFLIVAVIGPLVEETVKPLGVAFYIGRIRSAAEAFTLGMAAGVGFALVETVGYIGSGYQDWLSVALERTGASLLHGFGAAMVALGWYYLTHRKQGGGIVIAILCWLYAVFQHFIWNGTAILVLLPAPLGPALQNNLNLGVVSIPYGEILNIIEAILMLIFFLYLTARLRRQTPTASSAPTSGQGRRPEASGEPQALGRV